MCTSREHARLLALARSAEPGEVNVVPALLAAGILKTARPKSRGTIREQLLARLLGLAPEQIEQEIRGRRRAWPQTFFYRERGMRERWITRTALRAWLRSFHRNLAPDVRRALDRIAA